MLKLIRALLQKGIDDIDTGSCKLSNEDLIKLITAISNVYEPNPRMSKTQACDYLGVSRATFDNYIRNGWIPKGIKEDGFKELSWNKYDLDIYLNNFK